MNERFDKRYVFLWSLTIRSVLTRWDWIHNGSNHQHRYTTRNVSVGCSSLLMQILNMMWWHNFFLISFQNLLHYRARTTIIFLLTRLSVPLQADCTCQRSSEQNHSYLQLTCDGREALSTTDICSHCHQALALREEAGCDAKVFQFTGEKV